jgi:hypothetical protein
VVSGDELIMSRSAIGMRVKRDDDGAWSKPEFVMRQMCCWILRGYLAVLQNGAATMEYLIYAKVPRGCLMHWLTWTELQGGPAIHETEYSDCTYYQ